MSFPDFMFSEENRIPLISRDIITPSYWADIPGQFKAFIDRCTPWCNTHEPHATIKPGKTPAGSPASEEKGTGV